jgi:hypothetical protein
VVLHAGLLGTLTLVQEQGWRIHYLDLGPDLPVEEVLEAAWRLRLPGFLPYRFKLTGSA